MKMTHTSIQHLNKISPEEVRDLATEEIVAAHNFILDVMEYFHRDFFEPEQLWTLHGLMRHLKGYALRERGCTEGSKSGRLKAPARDCGPLL